MDRPHRRVRGSLQATRRPEPCGAGEAVGCVTGMRRGSKLRWHACAVRTAADPEGSVTSLELIARVNEMAASQHGLVNLEQFPESERGRVRHLARKGILQRVGRGVFRVSGAPETWTQTVHAGLWALGEQA